MTISELLETLHEIDISADAEVEVEMFIPPGTTWYGCHIDAVTVIEGQTVVIKTVAP